MWEDSVGSAFMWQSPLPALAVAALRVVAGLLVGFAVSLCCALVVALACLEVERGGRTAGAAR